MNDDVQGFWNCYESILVEIIDELAPMELQKDKITKCVSIPAWIKNKINRRDRLLKKTVANNTPKKKDSPKYLRDSN